MKWNPFKKTNSPTEELKQRNRFLQQQLISDNVGVFRKSSLFFRGLFSNIKLNEDVRDQVEELLLGLDFGPFIAEHLSKKIAVQFRKQELSKENLESAIRSELLEFYGDYSTDLNIVPGRTNILLMVGSNGSGKTTSIAKLAHKFKNMNLRVLLVAGDTFRAGAVDQLKKWSDILGIDIFMPDKLKEDPSSLIYKSLTKNAEHPYDLIICDTSGRQHNNNNLMQELSKIYKTIRRFDETAPHETLLVVDSTAGQVSLLQAEKFLQHSLVTGILLSKMDSMSKGGIIFAIKEKFKVPVKLVGVGESPDHLMDFDLKLVIESWMASLKD